jgi:hypothetical protein
MVHLAFISMCFVTMNSFIFSGPEKRNKETGNKARGAAGQPANRAAGPGSDVRNTCQPLRVAAAILEIPRRTRRLRLGARCGGFCSAKDH